MKKITLFFAALAVAFSASALKGDFGGEDGTVPTYLFNVSTGEYDFDIDPYTYGMKQKRTIAITIEESDPLYNWLRATPTEGYERAVVIDPAYAGIVNHENANFDGRLDARMKQWGTSDIWYIEVYPYDLFTSVQPNNTKNWQEICDLTLNPTPGVDYASPTTSDEIVKDGFMYLWAGFFGAEYDIETGAVSETVGYEAYSGTAMCITGKGSGSDGMNYNKPLGFDLTGTPNSVNNIISDKGEPVDFEVYSILGAKLNKYAKGLVVVKYFFEDGSVYTAKEMR